MPTALTCNDVVQLVNKQADSQLPPQVLGIQVANIGLKHRQGFGNIQAKYKTGPSTAGEGSQYHLHTICKSMTHPSGSSCTGGQNVQLAG